MDKKSGLFMYVLIFLAGGLAYCALELAWRGRTHPSMLLAGGFCVLLLYLISVRSNVRAWKKWITGGVLITTVEFITGIIVNILLGLNVWDYSTLSINLLGQISLYFSLLWVLLCIPVMWFMRLAYERYLKCGQRKDAGGYDGTNGY